MPFKMGLAGRKQGLPQRKIEPSKNDMEKMTIFPPTRFLSCSYYPRGLTCALAFAVNKSTARLLSAATTISRCHQARATLCLNQKLLKISDLKAAFELLQLLSRAMGLRHKNPFQ